MDPVSLIGIAISLGIALWQYRQAQVAQRALSDNMKQLPGQMVNDLSRLLKMSHEPSQQSEIATQGGSLTSRYADLNGDGEEELLVSYLSGPHNTALQVYGKRTPWEFGLLGEIYGSTPTEFDLEDVDEDGIPEVSVVEIAKAPDLPYVMGLRDRVSYKLTSSGFVEVKRVKGYTVEDLRERLSDWHDPNA